MMSRDRAATTDVQSAAGQPPVASKLFKNSGFLIGGRILGDIFFFILFVTLSRAFGQEGIGQYSFAIGFTGFFAGFAGFGLSNLSIKELSRRTSSFSDAFGEIFTLRLIISTVAIAALMLIIPFLPITRETKLIIAFVGVYQVVSHLQDGIVSCFIAREEMHLAGLIEVSLRATAALATIGVIIAGGGLVTALAVLPAITVGQLFLAYALVAKKYGRPKLVQPVASLARLARAALPYTQSTVLVQLSTRVDVVLLGFFLGASEAGIYNVAYRVVFMLMFVPHFAAIALFPLTSRLFVSAKEELEALYHQHLNLIIICGLPIAAGVWLVAPSVISSIFGEEFSESASVLRILSGGLFLAFLSRTMGVFLMSCDRQADRTKGHWIAAVANVLGNLILIPIAGVKGAAIAMLISESLLLIVFAVQLRAVLGWPKVSSRLIIGTIGIASFCVPLTLLPSLGLAIVIPAAVLIYLVTIALFNQTRNGEVRLLLSMLKRKPKGLQI